jgi:hypothetical protein
MEIEIKDIVKRNKRGVRTVDVHYQIIEGKKVHKKGILGYSADITTKELNDEMKKVLSTYVGEIKQAEKQAVIDNQDRNADNIIKELKGKKYVI